LAASTLPHARVPDDPNRPGDTTVHHYA